MTPALIPDCADPAQYVAGLIGRPWDRFAVGPDAFDCWGLVADVQDRLWDRPMPWARSLVGEDPSLRSVIKAIQASELQRSWQHVSRPAPGDLVIMCRANLPIHIGIWIDAGPGCVGILHCEQYSGVILQSLAQAKSEWPRIEFRRCVEKPIAALSETSLAFLDHVADRPVAVIVSDPLDPLKGAELIELEPNDLVAKVLPAIEGRAHEFWACLNDRPLLRRDPYTGKDEWQITRVQKGDVVWLLPALPEGGDDGSAVLSTILSIVISIAAPGIAAFVGGNAVMAAGGGLNLAGKLLSAGIAVGANLLISHHIRPDAGAALANPDPTYSFGQVQNRMRPGAMVPRIYGSMWRVPDLVTSPWAEFEDNEQIIHILLSLGQGQYDISEFGIGDTPVWTQAAGLTGAIKEIDFEILQPGLAPTLFPSGVEVNTEVDGLELPEPDETEGDTVLGPFAAVSAGSTASQLIFDFTFPRGLFSLPSAIADTTVTWIIEARVIDDYGQSVGFWQQLDEVSLSAGTTTAQRMTKRYDVEAGRYEVRLWRNSESTITGAGAQDALFWVGLKALNSDAIAYDDITTLALRLRADATSSSAVQEWYIRQTAILPFINAIGQVETGPTEQIDAAVLDIIKSEYGLGLDDDRIDMPSLIELSQLWTQRGDVCCTSIESETGAWDVLDLVLSSGRTKPQFVGAMITFVRDQQRLIASRLITPTDMVRGSFEIERAHYRRESPNSVIMRYRDRDGVMRSIECGAEAGGNSKPATVITQVMVDAEQVWREGNYLAATNNLRRRFPSWIMLEGGRALVRGDLIEVAHPRPDYGHPSQVVALNWPSITLSVETDLEPGETGLLRLTLPDGGVWGPVQVLGDADDAKIAHIDTDDFNVVLNSALMGGFYSADPRDWIVTEDQPDGPINGSVSLEGRQADPTRAVIGTTATDRLRCLVLEVTPREDGQVEVLAVTEDDNVHLADLTPLPADAEPAPALTNDAQPTWDGVIITGIEITDIERPDRVDFQITGPAVPGAVGYIYEWATSVAAGDWQDETTSTGPDFAGPSIDGVDISIRVAATGPILRGPWQYFRTQVAAAVGGVSVAISETGP